MKSKTATTMHRTLLRIVGVNDEMSSHYQTPTVYAVIHTLEISSTMAVPFSLDVVDNDEIRRILTDNFKAPLRVFAEVNIDADQPEDLQFRAFELAPEPDENVLRGDDGTIG